jgi:hypothetical protein
MEIYEISIPFCIRDVKQDSRQSAGYASTSTLPKGLEQQANM